MQSLKLRARSKSQDANHAPPPPSTPIPPLPAQPDVYVQDSPTFAMPQRMPTNSQYQDASQRELQQELLTRPLNRSTLGLLIVRCLTLPWVNAPSGLACCEIPVDGDWHVMAVADAINALACGAQAYYSQAANLLGVRDIGNLNRMLSRSGLTTVAPMSTPKPWLPLMVRQPPAFVCEGFITAHRPQLSVSSDGSGKSAAQPQLMPPYSPPLHRAASAESLGRPTRTMEQLMAQLREVPANSKQAHDLATALLMAERERFRQEKVPLRERESALVMAEGLARIGNAAISEEPFEYDGNKPAAPPPRSNSLPRQNK